jgi:hypothetical protein
MQCFVVTFHGKVTEEAAIYLCFLHVFLESGGDVGRLETAESRIGTALFVSRDTQHTVATQCM